MKNNKPLILGILDGWGVTSPGPGNAVTEAGMPFVESLKQRYPWVLARAAGEAVGLPAGQMGNSEVGHIHIGAGRIKQESLSMINNALVTGELASNPELLKAVAYCKKGNHAFHLIGLFSSGGVHSHMQHMLGIYKILVANGITKIYFHLIADGRDTAPKVFKNDVITLESAIASTGVGQIASLAGRYYTMDRDKRFERTNKSYEMMVNHTGNDFINAEDYINSQYQTDISDEFIVPAYNAACGIESKINDYDVVLFTNFRPDRAIQIASFFTNKSYLYKPEPFLEHVYFVAMRHYSDSVHTKHILFPPTKMINCLGEWLSKKGLTQLRAAETEKIAHVTFFLDGSQDYFNNGLAQQEDIKLKGASSVLIPSPKVATYDLKPEMSANKLTDAIIAQLDGKNFDVIVFNFANGDMVGHTGILPAAIEANRVMDNCLQRLYHKVQAVGGTMILTADHGNCEVMIDEQTGGPNKKHTTNKVPIIFLDKNVKLNQDAGIASIAPTILDYLGIEIPPEMTEPSLIVH